MATPRMNDPTWVASLLRAKAITKYEFVAIHVLAPLRNLDGVAPVVLQTQDGYLRAPAYMEAMFELCLRHLHHSNTPLPSQGSLTPQALLVNRATEALKLPGRYVPTVEGKVIDMELTEQADCHAASHTHEKAPDLGTTAVAADQSEAQQTTEPPIESLDQAGEAEQCVEEKPESTYSLTTAAALPDAEAEQIVEPPAPSIDGADNENDQAIEEELGSIQLATTAALDPSGREADTPGTEVDVDSAAEVDQAPSALSKKARRRAARKARRRCA